MPAGLYDLYLLQYNNYYNRIVKFEEYEEEITYPNGHSQPPVLVSTTALSKYSKYLAQYKGKDTDQNGNSNVVKNANFIEGDGVNTTQVVNWGGDKPDYLLVVDEDQEIVSRWFVINNVRTSYGQHMLTLHRDVVVDYYDRIITAPCFIERANITDPTDPAIYNSESISVNQIKRSEGLLKDETGSAWLVGYIARNTKITEKFDVDAYFESVFDFEVDNLAQLDYANFLNVEAKANLRDAVYAVQTYAYFSYSWNRGATWGANYTTSKLDTNGTVLEPSIYKMRGGANTSGSSQNYSGDPPYMGTSQALQWKSTPIAGNDNFTSAGTIESISSQAGVILQNYRGSVLNQMNGYIYSQVPGTVMPANIYQRAIADRGKVVHVKEGDLYFRIDVETVETATYSGKPIGGLRTLMQNNLNYATLSNLDATLQGTPDDASFGIEVKYDSIIIRLVQLFQKVHVDMTGQRYNLVDAPYDMFCIPFTDNVKITYNSREDGNNPTYKLVTIDNNSSAALAVANNVKAQLGSSLYDVQILPYCPARYIIREDGSLDASSVAVGTITRDAITTDADSVKDANGKVPISVILWCDRSSFVVPRVGKPIPQPASAIDRKMQYLTELYRLCSPNYSGIFEFSPAMNNGVQNFIADCTYKPFGPFIRVAPQFDGYYGTDFNDLRGLICGGDFSLAQLTDAWTEYQLQNKNYQQMFDRQIENMEVSRSVQREQENWAIASGAISAFGQSFSTGAMFGPWGALAGAGVGLGAAALSGAAGARDKQLNEKLYQENVDFSKDMFDMRNENIQALPQSIAKTSALTIDNKVFPFLERYTCTQKESNTLRERFRLRGMNVNRIDLIVNFIQNADLTYVKARLINIDSESELNYQIVTAIAGELYKGVYI